MNAEAFETLKAQIVEILSDRRDGWDVTEGKPPRPVETRNDAISAARDVKALIWTVDRIHGAKPSRHYVVKALSELSEAGVVTEQGDRWGRRGQRYRLEMPEDREDRAAREAERARLEMVVKALRAAGLESAKDGRRRGRVSITVEDAEAIVRRLGGLAA
jgi:hypothetical protein